MYAKLNQEAASLYALRANPISGLSNALRVRNRKLYPNSEMAALNWNDAEQNLDARAAKRVRHAALTLLTSVCWHHTQANAQLAIIKNGNVSALLVKRYSQKPTFQKVLRSAERTHTKTFTCGVQSVTPVTHAKKQNMAVLSLDLQRPATSVAV